MPNILFNTWVKIVNNNRKTTRKVCAYLSTIYQHNQYKNIARCVQTTLNYKYLPHNSTIKYTPKNCENNLLNKSFTYFPQHLLINPLNEN